MSRELLLYSSSCAVFVFLAPSAPAVPKAPQQINESRRSAPSARSFDGDFFEFQPLIFDYFGLGSVRFGVKYHPTLSFFTSRISYYLTIVTSDPNLPSNHATNLQLLEFDLGQIGKVNIPRTLSETPRGFRKT